MSALEFELDAGQPVSAADFFTAGGDLLKALDALVDLPVNWVIRELRTGSAVVRIEGDGESVERADAAFFGLVSGLRLVRSGQHPPEWSPDVVNSLRSFTRTTAPVAKGPRAVLRLIVNNEEIETAQVDGSMAEQLLAWQPRERLFQGSAVGRLVGVNIARGNRASLKPRLGRVIHVRFPDDLADDFKEALYSDVEVSGTLRRDEFDRVFHISADRVDLMSTEDEISWTQLFGIDPNFTGGQEIRKYVEESRGET